MAELKWTDTEWIGYTTASFAKGKLRWSLSIWGGSTLASPTYSLSIGEVLIIEVDIATLDAAKQLAQRIENVLDPPECENDHGAIFLNSFRTFAFCPFCGSPLTKES